MVTSLCKIVLLITSTNFCVDLKVVDAWSTVHTALNFGNTGTVPDVKIVTVYIPYYIAVYSGTLLIKAAAVKLNIMMKVYQVN